MKNTVDNTRDIKVLISQLSAFIKTISEILNNSNTAETARYASYADMARIYNDLANRAKDMSKPSGRTVSHSLALSGTPAVPLWNSIGLFISATAFGFWDLCGIEFCILKVLPTGFTSNSGCFLPQRAAQKLRRINKEISPGNRHISRLPLNRDSLLNKNAYSMACFSAAMRALLPENASPYLIIDLIPSACISAL